MVRGCMLTQERIKAMTAAGHWPNRTIVDYLDAAVRSTPDKLCVIGHNSITGRLRCGRTTSSLAHLEDQRLAKHYWPEHLEIIDEFPLTPSGKIQKFKLQELAPGFAVGARTSSRARSGPAC